MARQKQTAQATEPAMPPEGVTAGLVPLLVTTAHRGVFFGYGTPADATTIRLERARMCVYWSNDLHGVLGLASTGPSTGCRIGPAVPALTLREVTAVAEVSPAAAAAWEKGTWSR